MSTADAIDKKRLVIISDTHLAGGPEDPLEDHVWQGEPLRRFVDELTESADGRAGDIELIINGDFLEFVQAYPEAFRAEQRDRGFTEDESLAKLEVIIQGHKNVFSALRRFQEKGNRATIMAGNHDVDLYWTSVQERLRQASGPVRFELHEDWYARYDGRVHIAHGHQRDPANRFEDWRSPFMVSSSGEACLETCPGTRFVIGFVNPMDGRYPFVDNVKPFNRLLQVLLRYDLPGAIWAAKILAKFLLKNSDTTLAIDSQADRIRKALDDDRTLGELAKLAEKIEGSPQDRDRLRRRLQDPNQLDTFLEKALDWGLFDQLPAVADAAGRTLSAEPGEAWGGDDGATLGLIQERRLNVVEDLRDGAVKERVKLGAEIIVCGHTHVPDEKRRDGYVYYNTGSWTRYLQADEEKNLTLERLRDGEGFPYDLWYVDVQLGEDGQLESARHLFESGTHDTESPDN